MDFKDGLSEETKKIIDEILSVESRFIDSDADKLKTILGDNAGILAKEELTAAVEQINKLYATTLAAVLTTYNLSLEDYLNDATITTEKGTVVKATTVAEDFFRAFSDDNKLSTLKTLIDKIVENKEKKSQAADNAELTTPPEKVMSKPVNTVNYPVDKPNGKLWSFLDLVEPNGQLQFNFNTAPKGQEPALVYYSLQFEETEGVKISRQLTTFDKWVCIAVGALFNAGNRIITTNQIYHIMGGNSSLNDNDRTKILNSLKKMSAALITLDEKHEAERFNRKTYFKYHGHILNIVIGEECLLNGQVTKDAIKVLDEPPLIRFAKQRGQFTTLNKAVLAMPLSNTSKNLDIKDYLIDRISKMKRAKEAGKFYSTKILWDTIYKHCNITDHKSRTRNDVKKCLDYLMSEKGDKFIKSYSESPTKDGIIVKI